MADAPITLPDAAVKPLSAQEQAATGCNYEIKLAFDEISAALTSTTDSDTATMTWSSADVPNFVVTKAMAETDTPWTTTGTLTADFGTDGDPNNFIDGVDLKTAGPFLGAAAGAPETLSGSYGATADNLQIRIYTDASTGSPSNITGGKTRFLVNLLNLDKGA